MFEGLSGKFGKMKMPEGSLIKKLERIKKSSMPQENGISASLIPEMMQQLRKVPEEISRKIDEVENRNVDMIKANSRALKDLENQLNNLDQAVATTKNDTEEFNRRLEKLDKSVIELSSHEVISKAVDPLNEKMTNIDKRVEDIYNKPPEIPPLFIENLENRFNDLEGKLNNLDQAVLSTKNDTEEVISKAVDPLNEKITSMDGRMEDLYNKPPEIPPLFIENLENRFNDLKGQLYNLDQAALSTKKDTEEFNRRLEKLDQSVLELIPSHEIISKTVDLINEKITNIDKRIEDIYNKPPEMPPLFIENLENKFNDLKGQLYNLDQVALSTKKDTEEVISKAVDPLNEKITSMEKRIEDIYNRPPEMPPLFIENLENKFNDLEKNLNELKKTVESKAIDENAFVEKVAVTVVERLRPRKKHRDMYGEDAPGTESQVSQGRSGLQAPLYTVENDEEARLGYLDNKPDTSIILLNWIEFLMEKVGRNNLFDVLEYYIEIGWISRDVCSKMIAYASGIDYFVDRPSWKLLPEDHTKSLMFIEQLCGNKVDRMLYSRLERDVNRIIRTSKELSVH